MKEYLLSKHSTIAAINYWGAIITWFLSNPLGNIIGILTVVACLINIALGLYKWKNRKEMFRKETL